MWDHKDVILLEVDYTAGFNKLQIYGLDKSCDGK